MQCHLCNYFCNTTLKGLITHWRVFHSLVEYSVYECSLPSCGRRFPSLNSFKRHFKIEHSAYFTPSYNASNSQNCVRSSIASLVNDSNNETLNAPVGLSDNNDITTFNTDNATNLSTSPCILMTTDEELNDCFLANSSNVVNDTSFFEIVKFQVMCMITNLYSKPSIPRNIVQCVIEEMTNIFTVPIKIVQNTVDRILIRNSVPLDQQREINAMFEVFYSVLQESSTEYLRFKSLREAGILTDPFSHQIGEDFETRKGKEMPKSRFAQIIPLRTLLKSFLETGDVLDCILHYMDSLKTPTTVISNIIQGKVFKRTCQKFVNKVVMPLSMFFDAYEVGNSLGSHCGVHNLGAAYIILESVPPAYRTSLENVFLVMLLHYQDLRKNGNSVRFSKLIEEFNYLAETGILVETKTKKLRVYFVLAAIKGDNLGLNTILGYSESFSSNYYCRICKMSKADAQYAIVADNTILRTKINYPADV